MLTSGDGIVFDQRIIDTAVDSGVLAFMLVSKLLVDISSTNCDLLYYISNPIKWYVTSRSDISCFDELLYVIAKYRDINMNAYWTAQSQVLGGRFLDHGV